MKHLTIFAACLLAMSAQAQEATSTAVAGSNAQAGAASQAAAVSANQQGNEQSIQFINTIPDVQKYETRDTQHITYSGKHSVKTVPGVVVSGPASGPCNGASGGVGIAGVGFGVGANFSKVDEGCEDRETARMLGMLGRSDLALQLLMSSEVWKRHLNRIALMPAPVPVKTADAAEIIEPVAKEVATVPQGAAPIPAVIAQGVK